MKYLIGIDVGTTSARALIINEEAKIISEGVAEYPLYTPRPAWAQQCPEDWAKGVCKAIGFALRNAKIRKEDIAGVGLTGQMHSAVFLDKNNEVIRPAILWCDGRTDKECEEITKRVGLKKLLKIARNIALPGFTAPKILWLKNNEPKAYEKIARVLVTKDYIRFLMTGDFATDVSDASGTLLLDVKKRNWSHEILQALDIPIEWLPDVFESPVVTGKISKEGAKLFGLREGVPVVAGGGDQSAGAVGNGIIKEGEATISLGTSGVVFAPSSVVPKASGATVHAFCHAVPGMWHTMGVMLSAGGSVQWFRNTMRFGLNSKFSYVEMDALAEKSPPGAGGLIFLPYLTGERTPHNDPFARGSFVGISLTTRIEHLARAVLEGVAFGIKDCADLMEKQGVQIEDIYISGGGARSKLWCAIVASVLNKPIMRLDVDEGPAMGASLLAGVGVGVWKNVMEATENLRRVKDKIRPVKKWVETYERIYENFINLYPSLKTYFRVSSYNE